VANEPCHIRRVHNSRSFGRCSVAALLDAGIEAARRRLSFKANRSRMTRLLVLDIGSLSNRFAHMSAQNTLCTYAKAKVRGLAADA